VYKAKTKEKKEDKRNKKKRAALSNKTLQLHHYEENSKDLLGRLVTKKLKV